MIRKKKLCVPLLLHVWINLPIPTSADGAEARLLTGSKKYEHIPPVLALLHKLSVNFRIQFKILLVVFKAFNG